MRIGRRTAGVAVLGIVAALTLSSCGGHVVVTATPIPVSSAWHPGLFVEGYGPSGLGPSPTGTASASALDVTQQTLASVGLQPADFGNGLSVALASNGTALSVHSLSYCSADYPSESDREARRRMVAATTSGTEAGVVSEAVYYRTASAAGAALMQLRVADEACPSPRTTTAGNQTATLTVVPSDDVDVSGLVPADHRLIVSTTVDPGAAAGGPYRVTRVWQVRGRVLVALFFTSSSSTATTRDLSDMALLAARIATRLDALKSDVAGVS
jgi:hypothetical protein